MNKLLIDKSWVFFDYNVCFRVILYDIIFIVIYFNRVYKLCRV